MQAVLILLKCPRCSTANRMIVSSRNRTPPRCGNCKEFIFDLFTVIFGFVYILSNPAIPGLVKIGHTKGSLQSRVNQLSAATGVPKPFVVEGYFFAEKPKEDELMIHHSLASRRHKGREFFSLSVSDALAECQKVLGRKPQYVRSIHGEYKEP